MTLDQDHLDMLRALGDDVLQEIVAVYLQSTPDNFRAISAAVLENDLVRIRREAHSLKGASGNVGAKALSLACRELEAAAAEGAHARIPGAWGELQLRYSEAQEALSAL